MRFRAGIVCKNKDPGICVWSGCDHYPSPHPQTLDLFMAWLQRSSLIPQEFRMLLTVPIYIIVERHFATGAALD